MILVESKKKYFYLFIYLKLKKGRYTEDKKYTPIEPDDKVWKMDFKGSVLLFFKNVRDKK
jgi:hypothetical protein